MDAIQGIRDTKPIDHMGNTPIHKQDKLLV